MKWPTNWTPKEGGTSVDTFVREFRREAAANHPFANVQLRTVGTGDADNVLFELLDGWGRFAAVHLTFSRSRETDPRWPDTKVYDDWAHFEREGEDF